eukprot:TRINITY_DN7395_c0_g1_i2.p1 TRINITY_DN7395_c0_g1~~TRINITY_DN7395_c0_g1_i2.p1  ORF type:complete len:463 (-),score=87.63 TRINITY_DN7395_c0_g1_i2:563-1804(-)
MFHQTSTVSMFPFLVILVSQLVMSSPISDWYPGIATHFQGPQDLGDNNYDPKVPMGSCGYGELDPKLYPFWGVAQLSSFSPMVAGEKLGGCGACFEVQCMDQDRCPHKNSTTVIITDSCTSGCVQQQVNMHVFEFQHLAPSKWGEIPIRFRRVPCDPPAGMVVRVTDYRESAGGWIKIVIMEVAGKANIANVGLRHHKQHHTQNISNLRWQVGDNAQSAWMQMNNSYGAAWELSGVPQPPFDIKVEMEGGETALLEKVIVDVRVGGTYESHAQIYDADMEVVPEALQVAQSSTGFIGDVSMFPVFSMPPLHGSTSQDIMQVSPLPPAAQRNPAPSTSLNQRLQESMPPVSLDQLLNPTITLTQTSPDNSTVEELATPKLTYQLQNSTDWTYLAQFFTSLGWMNPPESKTTQKI